MGNNSWIGGGCKFFVGNAGIKIGNNVAIAFNNTFITNNHNYKSDKLLPFDEMNFSYPIEVGNNVWIGLGCIVLCGVKIGDGAVIAAGSVLTKSVPECAIVAGNPAKIVGWRDKDVFNKLVENGDFLKIGTEPKFTVVNKFKPFLAE